MEDKNIKVYTLESARKAEKERRIRVYKSKPRPPITLAEMCGLTPEEFKYRIENHIPLGKPTFLAKKKTNAELLGGLTLDEKAKELGISKNLLKQRLCKGIPIDMPIGAHRTPEEVQEDARRGIRRERVTVPNTNELNEEDSLESEQGEVDSTSASE